VQEVHGLAYTNMKNIFTLLIVISTLSASAQIDSIINYNDSLIYRIDTTVYYGNDSSIAPNYVKFNYHYISLSDSIWESQLIVVDTGGNYLGSMSVLVENGAGASGTTWFTKLDAASVLKTPLQLCDSLFLPKYQLYIGTTIKL